jgi:hypothetical protein
LEVKGSRKWDIKSWELLEGIELKDAESKNHPDAL